MREDWQIDFDWLRIRHYIRDSIGGKQLPDMKAILFLIGVQELGEWSRSFSKEEKQDLMHIATCRLLEDDGYYRFVGRDEDGWPHFEAVKPVQAGGLEEQEYYLKEKIINYFNELEKEHASILEDR